MMQRFIRDTQNEVLQHLSELVNLLNQDKIQRTKWYHSCVALNRSLNEVNNLVRNAQFYIVLNKRLVMSLIIL